MDAFSNSGALRFFGWLLGLTTALAVFFFGIRSKPAPLPRAKGGTLTLQTWEGSKKRRWPLRGQWKMHWGKLWNGAPESRPSGEPLDVTVPSYWNQVRPHNTKRPRGFGFATYRLRVVLPKAPHALPERLQLKLPHQLSSARIWVQEELSKNSFKALHPAVNLGQVGTSERNYRPQVRSRVISFPTPPSRVLVVVYQVANFHHARGGLYLEPVLGVASLENYFRQHRYKILLLIGVFLCMAFYHFLLFAFRRQDKAALWMGWLCLLVALRSSLTEEILYEWAHTTFLWQQCIRLEYITTYLPAPVFLYLLYALYPKIASRRFVQGTLLLGLAFAALTVVTPTEFHTKTLGFYQPAILVMILYGMVVLVKSIFQTNSLVSRLIFLGCFAGLLAGVNDVLYTYRWIDSTYLLHYGIGLYIMLQALVLAIHNQQNLHAIEKYAVKLEALNYAAMRFVPRDFLSLLGKNEILEVQLSDNIRADMAVMFSDIRGFTSLSESMTPDENFDFVNEWLLLVNPIIRDNHGFVVKYMGDGLMAVFPHSVDDALRAAIQKIKVLDEYNKNHEHTGIPPVRVGLGINFGSMMLGVLGAAERWQSDVMSDAVNLASRMESATKHYSVTILVTEAVFQALRQPEDFFLREIDFITVKGKQKPVKVYEVFDVDAEDVRDAKQANAEFLQQAIKLYRMREFSQAVTLLQQCQKALPEDPVIALYLERCEAAITNEPDESWDGIERLARK